MKRKLILALAVLTALSLSACQATPTHAIVKEKNLDKMIEKATKTQPPSSADAAQSATAGGDVKGTQDASATPGSHENALAKRMGAPEKWQKELVDAKGKVKIHVNADVFVPDAAGVAVQRVEQAKFSQQQVDTLVSCLMKGDLFSGNDYKPSKSDIQNQILQIQAALAKTPEDDPSNAGGKPASGSKETLQFQLDQLNNDLKTAPDQSVKTPITTRFTAINPDDGGGEELFALSQPASDVFQSIHVYNYSDGTSFLRYASEKKAFSKSQMAYFNTKEAIEAELKAGHHSLLTQDELDAIPELKLSEEDAKKAADAIVSALGLKDVVCVSEGKEYGGGNDMTANQQAHLNPRRSVWFLRYARSVNNVPATYTVWDCMKVETNQQSAPWSYEDMTFAIDDSGVAYFDWRAPYRVTGTVTDNSNVLSFKDTTDIFNTMALAVNSWDGLTEGWTTKATGFDFNVDRVVFGLTRVTEQNKRNSGLLVPCWDFFADVTFTETVNGQPVTRNYDNDIPILTINAIDGSIINRSLGY